MKFTLQFSAAALMLLAAPPVFAFTVETGPSNRDDSPRFADPDNQADQMSEQLQPREKGGGASSSFSFGSAQEAITVTRPDRADNMFGPSGIMSQPGLVLPSRR